MLLKIIGALLVVFAGGGVGFQICATHRRQERELRKLISVLDFMECELQYRMTPLPDLCRQAAGECSGSLRAVFLKLTTELEDQISPDVGHCMTAAVHSVKDLTQCTVAALLQLGHLMGRFDIDGQLKGLDAVRNACRKDLDALCDNKDMRLRSYQTIGLCAGAAVAILLV